MSTGNMATVHWQYGDGALAIWRRCTGNMATLAYFRGEKKLGVARVCGHFENRSQSLDFVDLVDKVAQGAALTPYGARRQRHLGATGGNGGNGETAAP